jgi:predicted RND superfamily exporter protein
MFLDKYYGKEIMSREGRYVILFIYAVMIVFGIYGASQLEVDFKIEYFIPKDSAVWGYLEYFNNGESLTIYVENPDINYASKET